jgi:hypothetical protein
MSSLAIIEVAIGLFTVYAILALVNSALGEAVSQWLKMRAENLRHAIGRMLDDDGSTTMTDAFYANRIIRSLSGSKDRGPSYIPREGFARVVLEEALRTATGAGEGEPSEAERRGALSDLRELGELVEKLPEGQLRSTLGQIVAESGASVDEVRARLEGWFDGVMDRASGWFKRRMGRWLFAIGVALAALTNADTIEIVRTLYVNPVVRAQMVELAEQRVAERDQAPARAGREGERGGPEREGGVGEARSTRSVVESDLASIAPLIGWTERDARRLLGRVGETEAPPGAGAIVGAWVLKLTGLLMTAVAISAGAPFWFDLVGKLISLRGSVKETTERTAPAQRRRRGGGAEAEESSPTRAEGAGPLTNGQRVLTTVALAYPSAGLELPAGSPGTALSSTPREARVLFDDGGGVPRVVGIGMVAPAPGNDQRTGDG